MFKVITRDALSLARRGVLETPHGSIETPSYVVVGTHGMVRCLEREDLFRTKTQVVIANTYHLWRNLGEEGLAEFPGLHTAMGWEGPFMTDSGGFQVFSMGAAREHGVGKVTSENTSSFRSGESTVRVTNAGVYFMDGGEELYLDAELSMRIQEQLGADIIFAFDEPSSPLHDYAYTKRAMERTHTWAERSIEALRSLQALYGIVQGGSFEDLRKESAKKIGSLPFSGFAIGGAFGSSFGGNKEGMPNELSWTIPFLPRDKPRHLLGIGRIEDLFLGVEAGIDTFDCVIPTREARHGSLWTANGRFDVTRGIYRNDNAPLDASCECFTCGEENVTKKVLHAYFKEKNLEAGRLATIHNVYFFNDLMRQIRESIERGMFLEFRKQYLATLAAGGVDK